MSGSEPAVVEELRALAYRYASGVDRRDRVQLLSAFHPDATLTVVRGAGPDARRSRPMQGHAEIGRIVERIAVYSQTFHFLGQSDYSLTEAGASGEIWCIAHHRWPADDAELDHIMYIRYTDEYRIGGDSRWRIADRAVVVDWSETRVVEVPGRTPH